MNARHFFPLGKAYGKAFCNRVEETKKLMGNIEGGKHTFLVAPRRYGKSSLCEHAFEQSTFAWSKIDFHLTVTEKDAERVIINGVTDLIGKSVGSVEKLVNVIKKYAKTLKPKLVVGTKNLRLELSLSEDTNPTDSVAEAILILESLLRERGKQAVLLLDEFQEIGTMERGKGIEGAIRHAAQETQNLSLIFSGSNPNLLKIMFEDERRPLYKLCRKLVLDRIEKDDYKKHLNKASKIMWGTELDENVFEHIMLFSERHPYYVNYLCDELWSNNILPTAEKIKASWDAVIEEERSDLLKDFFSLADNQRRLMIYIANNGGENLYSHEASKKMGIPVGSITRALSSLIEKDYIEKTEEKYRLIVPAYNTLLATTDVY